MKRLRRLASLGVLVGIACQVGTCLDQATITALLQQGGDILTRQTANIISDTVFFLLDNFFVRLRG